MKKIIVVLLAAVALAGCASLTGFLGIPQFRTHDVSLLRVGMTSNEVVDAIGPPDEINRTTTSAGKSEQWVYMITSSHYIYVYLENDYLVAWQD
jgi:outer membrane protein assembly factor BamE (lipoprotein component of BamABCDE complex)